MSGRHYRCRKQLMRCGTPTVNCRQVRRSHRPGNISPPTKALRSSCLPISPNRTSFGIKVVSVYDDNPNLDLPRITATVLVLDPTTGAPKAFIDGGSLTAIRTGCWWRCSGGPARAGRTRKRVGLFGAGVQARSQLQAVMAVRDITRVNLISRTAASAETTVRWRFRRGGMHRGVNLARHPKAVIADADIVICATNIGNPTF